MSPSSPSLYPKLLEEFPELELFLGWMAAFFRLPQDLVRQRFAQGLEDLDPETARRSCEHWRQIGVFPKMQVRHDHQVAALWQSPLWQILLDHVIQFAPPANTDIRPHLPEPCQTVEDFLQRTLPPMDQGYWRHSLHLPLHELYLIPFLDTQPGKILQGCDLACGWGRGTLSLLNHPNLNQNVQIYGCDLSNQNLKRYRHLIQTSGLTQPHSLHTAVPVRTPCHRLPFPDNTFDFLILFDILEHLTLETLKQTLQECLRTLRPGAILYTEVPLDDYCPPATHLQRFEIEELFEYFKETRVAGQPEKKLQQLLFDQRIACMSSWQVTHISTQPRTTQG